MGRRNHKKRRTAEAAEPSAAFLAALEQQRANARAKAQREAAESAESAESGEAAAPKRPRQLAGFYFDESKQRYFRLDQGRRQARGFKIRLSRGDSASSGAAATGGSAEKASRLPSGRRTGLMGVFAPATSLQATLNKRQHSYSRLGKSSDVRALKPLVLGRLFEQQVLEAQQDISAGRQNRLTGLALHPNAKNLGAVGYSNGRVEILGTERVIESRARSERSNSGSGRQTGRVRVPTLRAMQLNYAVVDSSSWVSSLDWRPQRSLDLIYSAIGATNPTRAKNGFVGFMNVAGSRLRTIRKWWFTDPWTSSWNPCFPDLFSVGYGEAPYAANVLPEFGSTIMKAPSGLCASPVTSQAFFSKSSCILNGTRNGSLWIWDVRAKKRAQELVGNYPSSVTSLSILQDDMRVVVQRSHGQLALLDVRNYNQVLQYAPGSRSTHLPMLKCVVDCDDSVVIAAGGDAPTAITTFNLQTGKTIATVHANIQRATEADGEDTTPSRIEQVHLLGDHSTTSRPELWALSRSDLFVCSSWMSDWVGED